MSIDIESSLHELIVFKNGSAKLQKNIIAYCNVKCINAIVEIIFNFELFTELSPTDRNKIQKKKTIINKLIKKTTGEKVKRKILLELMKIGLLHLIISSFLDKCCNVC
jgi:hypothetical protein